MVDLYKGLPLKKRAEIFHFFENIIDSAPSSKVAAERLLAYRQTLDPLAAKFLDMTIKMKEFIVENT